MIFENIQYILSTVKPDFKAGEKQTIVTIYNKLVSPFKITSLKKMKVNFNTFKTFEILKFPFKR